MVLALSGGEPMLNPHWRTLVGHAKARGLATNIGSNGSCITERTADEIKALGVQSVTVSLDSHLAETHDHFRQCQGLYQRAIRAIQLLVARGVRVVVGFTPTRLNWQHGPEVVRLACELGADAVNLSEYVPAGRGGVGLALTPQTLHQVLRDWIALREEYWGRIQIIWHDCRVGMLVADSEQRKYVGCGAGRLVARIYPDGRITPCVFLPTSIGSVRDTDFKALWDGSDLLLKFRNRSGNIGGSCGSCRYLETCGGCRAVAFAYSGGNPLAGDPHCWIQETHNLPIELLPDGEALPV
jgi:radical SAM protein with 4Fe4S-binding SPASM domain